MEYLVLYEIEVDADSPERAARMVADLLRERADKGIYKVQCGESFQYIDLLKLEELDNVN